MCSELWASSFQPETGIYNPETTSYFFNSILNVVPFPGSDVFT